MSTRRDPFGVPVGVLRLECQPILRTWSLGAGAGSNRDGYLYRRILSPKRRVPQTNRDGRLRRSCSGYSSHTFTCFTSRWVVYTVSGNKMGNRSA